MRFLLGLIVGAALGGLLAALAEAQFGASEPRDESPRRSIHPV
jgi:hypothetical protein